MSRSNKCIIEVILPGTHRPQYHTFEKGEVIIGRAYDCDLVVRDDFVSKKHLKISAEKEGFLVSDLSSLNGTTVHKTHIKDTQMILESGQECRLGKTRIRIFSASHEIPQARSLNWGTKTQTILEKPVVMAILWIVSVITAIFYGAALEDPKTYMDESIYKYGAGMTFFIPFFALLCSVENLVRHKKAAFTLQVSLTVLATLFVMFCIVFISPYLFFYIQYNTVETIMDAVFILTVIMLICMTWAFISEGRIRRKDILQGFAVSFVLIGISNIGQLEYTSSPVYPSTLVVADMYIPNPLGIEDYLTQAQGVFNNFQ